LWEENRWGRRELTGSAELGKEWAKWDIGIKKKNNRLPLIRGI
jgi:hypothetical protein